MNILTIDHILNASTLIESYIHRTPILTNQSINRMVEADIYFKCENFQKTGSFKYRGATHAILKFKEQKLSDSVATHSSGNHAAALSLAAQIQNIKAHIVMPRDAPVIKKKAVEQYHGIITYCEPNIASREETLQMILAETAAKQIHPYNDFDVICGQGTAALEMIQSCPPLDVIMTPIGGGGLMSGTSIAAKALLPTTRIIGVEPLVVADAKTSIETGQLQPPFNQPTLADGLRTALSPLTFEILTQKKVEVITCSEESIVAAMQLIWERMKIVVEPSSAVPLAAVLENKTLFRHTCIGIILTGGNVDLNHLPFR